MCTTSRERTEEHGRIWTVCVLFPFYKTTAWLLAGGIVRRISNDGELDIVIRNSLGPIRRSSGLTVSNSAVLGPFLHPGNLGDMEQSTWWCRKILNQCRTAPKDARMARSFNSWWTRNKRCWTAEANTCSYTCRNAILPVTPNRSKSPAADAWRQASLFRAGFVLYCFCRHTQTTRRRRRRLCQSLGFPRKAWPAAINRIK